ncbi:MAG TPA: hydrolase 2, exosortase A system-associated [Burkholderiaceae bacterium]|nr:hydrolase 2, exosortase A system-associated [Burkholderiaceae bacterium]
MGVAPQAFFMPASARGTGHRLCLYHAPQGPVCHAALVYVHPFAEEMNKSRRMAALQSRVFARAGFAVLQIDLLGCGDSSGDFEDATWQDWIDDVGSAVSWIRERHPVPLALWGLRAGCLLAAAAAQRVTVPCDLLLWQPAPSGKALLRQFLRLQVAGERLDGDGDGATDVQTLRERIAAGAGVEIAGYRPSAALAAGLDDAVLVPPRTGSRIAWLEVSARAQAELLPASGALVQRWEQAGYPVAAQVVQGPPFWQTVEIEEAPALLDATLSAMIDMLPAVEPTT